MKANELLIALAERGIRADKKDGRLILSGTRDAFSRALVRVLLRHRGKLLRHFELSAEDNRIDLSAWPWHMANDTPCEEAPKSAFPPDHVMQRYFDFSPLGER